jgi:hypothetical protein
MSDAQQSRLIEDFYTEEQLANEINRSARTIARMREAGVGPPWKRLGKIIIYPKNAAKEWIHADVIDPVRNRRARTRKASPRPPPSERSPAN